MARYAKLYNPNTPQSQPIDKSQVLNHAGGYVFEVTPWVRLERFLILGSETPTYYQNAQTLTKENAKCVIECWETDHQKTLDTIVTISDEGRAPKNSPAIFALALGTINEKKEVRQTAYLGVAKVCRQSSHLFEWMDTCRKIGKGSGRGFKRVLANWYKARSTEQLAFQAIKYRQRNSYTHKRAIELSNMGPGKDDEARVNLYRWVRGKEIQGGLPSIVDAHIEAMSLDAANKKHSKRLVELITTHKLPWEAIPTWALTDADVWEALIPTVGLTALIRNLGNITACGALTTDNYKVVTERLLNEKALDKARIHPFNVLQALSIYKSGKGLKGNKTWVPVTKVIDALDEAFYKCFKYVEPTGKRILVALDVSGSMTSPIGSPVVGRGGRYGYLSQQTTNPLSCREAAAAMCLVTLKTEENVDVIGFCSSTKRSGYTYGSAVTPLNLSARQRLDDVVKATSNLPFGGTDCALPMIWADEHSKKYDAIIIYTDNETWAGTIHPKEALVNYRRQHHIDTKLVVCAMTSTGFSIADPNDLGMLDICGLDSAVPSLINNFIK